MGCHGAHRCSVRKASRARSPSKSEEVANKNSVRRRSQTKHKPRRRGFELDEFVVYPAHGVGQIVAIEEQEVAGFKLKLFIVFFSKDKLTLRVPTSTVAGVGMRKISDPETAKRSLDILSARARSRVKSTTWPQRAQEYETKINSGDIAIAESCVTFTDQRRNPSSPIRSDNCTKPLSTGWFARSPPSRSRTRSTR